jgi:hypothetical protein
LLHARDQGRLVALAVIAYPYYNKLWPNVNEKNF